MFFVLPYKMFQFSRDLKPDCILCSLLHIFQYFVIFVLIIIMLRISTVLRRIPHQKISFQVKLSNVLKLQLNYNTPYIIKRA